MADNLIEEWEKLRLTEEENSVLGALIEIDINKPLHRGVKIAIGSSLKWCGIQYERLTEFCYYCGKMDHTDNECQFFEASDLGKEVIYEYGPCLGASPKKQNHLTVLDCEKERTWLAKLQQPGAPKLPGYHSPSVIRKGPPGVARKLSFVGMERENKTQDNRTTFAKVIESQSGKQCSDGSSLKVSSKSDSPSLNLLPLNPISESIPKKMTTCSHTHDQLQHTSSTTPILTHERKGHAMKTWKRYDRDVDTSMEEFPIATGKRKTLDSLIVETERDSSRKRTPYSHSLTIHAPDLFSITISLQPSTFSIFRTRPGSKSIQLNQTHDHQNQNESQPKIKLYYDFTRAEFAQPNSAEPESRFYLAFIRNGRLEFLLGDLREDLSRRVGLDRVDNNSAESTLLSRREHVFGRRIYATRSEFLGSTRSIEIECSGGTLKVKFDGELKVNVKRLAWKFRGNERMMVDGIAKNGVFVFQVGEGGVWPEMVGPEKRLMRKNSPAPGTALSPAGSCSSVLQWAEESSDCGRSSSGIALPSRRRYNEVATT
uniref:Zinc knuckle CX2CX4HX4C domain-containing protein n=1 Tax=Chenopodium quinoa TaxID=63459 RepID=A0A803KPM2_CHEQI